MLRHFFNCYLAAPLPALGHYRGDSLTHPMLITVFYILDPKVSTRTFHGEPHNVVGSLSPTKCLARFELGTFQFLLQRLNPLGHSPLNRMVTTKWTNHKEWSSVSNYFIFLENLFQFQNLLKRVDLVYQ